MSKLSNVFQKNLMRFQLITALLQASCFIALAEGLEVLQEESRIVHFSERVSEMHQRTPRVLLRCMDGCASNKRSWKRKCGWKRCDGCYECLPDSADGESSELTDETTSISCRDFCYRSEKGWIAKCRWERCMNCIECTV